MPQSTADLATLEPQIWCYFHSSQLFFVLHTLTTFTGQQDLEILKLSETMELVNYGLR